MPAQDSSNKAPFDYRPVGAGIAALPPGVSLLEYIFREYPQYRKILEAAPDATLSNGLVDLKKVMQEVQPGDFGLSGVQGGGDLFTNTLVRGSHAASGGPGAHGQVAGPYVRPHWSVTGVPKGEMGPPLPYLINDRGELYSPQMRDPEAWRKSVAADAKENMQGTESYGNAKERLRGRTKQLAQLQARQKAWDAYDAAVSAGKSATPPKVPRPDLAEVNKAVGAKTKAVKGFKRFLARVSEDASKTQTGELKTGPRGGLRETWSPTFEGGFFDGPDTKAQNFERELTQLTGSADRQEALAKRFDEMAAKNPKFKQIAQDLRRTAPERWDSLARSMEARGLQTPTQKRTVEALLEAAGGNPSALPKSKLFKPKQFETFVPSLLHGGMSATNTGRTPADYIAAHGADLPKDAIKGWWQKGLGGARDAVRDWLDGFRDNTGLHDDGWIKTVERQLEERPQRLVPHGADTVYKHTVTEGSSQNPRGYYRGKKEPIGHKPTLWMRVKEPYRAKINNEAEFLQAAKRMGVDPYAGVAAGQTALGEVAGLNTFRRMFGRTNCYGTHCGGGPASLYERLIGGKFKGDPNAWLPNRVALSDIFEPVLVTHKGQAMKDLAKGFRGRVGAGLGAIGLMGAAGYGLTGFNQSLWRSPKLPPQPKLDPHMFAKAMTLLKPPQQQA